jgi:phosphatidylglycerophosphate synthase
MLTLGLGFGLSWALALGESFVPKSIAVYVVVLGVAVHFLPLHRPRLRLGPANQVTLVRAVLISLLAALVGEGASPDLAWTALALALIAETLDGLDGHLARRWDWASAFGARFDLEADALLVAVLAVLAWTLDKAGPWVLAAGVLRYLFVGAAYLWPWMRRPLPPSRRRQAVCVLQVLTLTLALTPVLPPNWSEPVAAAGLALLCWSFAVDTLWLADRAGRVVRAEELP